MPRSIPICILALVLLCSNITEVSAASGAAPDGAHRLIEIFPGSDSPALAGDIAAQMGVPNTDYVPVSSGAFDGITTVSLPTSDVKYIDGLQYCRYLKHLHLFANLLTGDKLAVLVGMTSITHIDLSGNEITSGGLAHLSGLPLEMALLNKCDIDSSGLPSLPASIVYLELAKNKIDDAGAESISSRLTSLTKLDLSDNEIGDKGATALAKIPNRANMSINLRNNHIGSAGMKALIAAGFKSLELDGQTLTADTLTDGRTPIVHKIIVDDADMGGSAVSDNGVYDASSSSVTWPATNRDGTYTYTFRVGAFGGTVSVPFKYQAFVYHVTFVDGLGGSAVVDVKDESAVTPPSDPIREGFIFTGWSLSEDGTGQFDFATPITGDIRLYAGWTQNVEDTNTAIKDEKNEKDTDDNNGGDKRSGKHGNPDTGDNTFPELAPWACLISMYTMLILIGVYRKSGSRRERRKRKIIH